MREWVTAGRYFGGLLGLAFDLPEVGEHTCGQMLTQGEVFLKRLADGQHHRSLG